MSDLPVCNIPKKLEEDQSVFSNKVKDDYTKLCDLIKSYIGGQLL